MPTGYKENDSNWSVPADDDGANEKEHQGWAT